MNARVAGWLSLTLARITAGASPVDGSHGFGVRSARRRRADAARANPTARRLGQTQFVRGLS
jgi:hypothetical protein